MFWFNLWDSLKNKICRYFLKRYLGQFLDEDLDLEQFNVELYDGKATISNVSLRVEALNEHLKEQGCPLEFTHAHIGQLTACIPWNALMVSNSSIQADDVTLVLRPIRRTLNGISMLESMWSSASNSLQLAEECMKLTEEETDSADLSENNIIGVEKFTETIDNVLNRISAKITNLNIKLEYTSEVYSSKTIAIHILLDEINYKNETGSEQIVLDQKSSTENVYKYFPAIAKHKIILNNLYIYTEEFDICDKFENMQLDGRDHDVNPLKLLIVHVANQQLIEIKVKQSEEITGAKVSFDIELSSIKFLLLPRQIHLLLKYFNAFIAEAKEDTGDMPLNPSFHPFEYVCLKDDANFSETTNSVISESSLAIPKDYGEISNFAIKIAAVGGIILERDLLMETNFNANTRSIWHESILEEINKTSQEFFSENDFQICEKSNHLLFFNLQTICVKGKQQRKNHNLHLNNHITIKELIIDEVLNGKRSSLLMFDHSASILNGKPRMPDVTLEIATIYNANYMRKAPPNQINILLEDCNLEVDMSLYDRLGALFANSPFDNCSSSKNNKQKANCSCSCSSTNIETDIICSNLKLRLRLPIYDASPLCDPNRLLWWQQNIRQDYFLLFLKDIKLRICKHISDLTFCNLKIFYCAKSDDDRIEFLNVNSDLKVSDEKSTNGRITLQSCNCVGVSAKNVSNKIYRPFSSKKSWRQGNSARTSKNDIDDTETIYLPGETYEINDFCEHTMTTSSLKIHLYMPILDLYFESKDLYEIVYNRLNADLFMWEPSSPYFLDDPSNPSPLVSNSVMMDSIYGSTINHDCNEQLDTDSEESDNNSDQYDNDSCCQSSTSSFRNANKNLIGSLTYTQTELPNRTEIIPKHNILLTTKCSFELSVGKTYFKIYVPKQKVSEGTKETEADLLGKFILIVDQLKLFVANAFRGDSDLAYLCVQAVNAEIYHCECVPQKMPLNTSNTNIEDFMQALIYMTPDGLRKGTNINTEDRTIFSLVIEIKKIPTNKLKRLKITIGIKGMTLRYNTSSPTHAWFTQLMDFLDVTDVAIKGYQPYSVISEIQCHLWDCAIDFRPRDFIYRCLVEIVYFTMNSNIISAVTSCNLRFVIEEAVLSIAPYNVLLADLPEWQINFLDCGDLVPILDVGLVDISLRLNKLPADKCPQFDIRSSMHDIHMRTCYDSGSALAQLIAQLTTQTPNNRKNYGNKQVDKQATSNNSLTSANSYQQQVMVPHVQDEVTQEHIERVSLLMADAVQDTVSNTQEKCPNPQNLSGNNVELIDVIDLDNMNNSNDSSNDFKDFDSEVSCISNAVKCSYEEMVEDDYRILSPVKSDLGDLKFTENVNIFKRDYLQHSYLDDDDMEDNILDSDIEDDFVITDTINGKFIEIPNDPLRIVDNHFCIPKYENDLLKSPDKYPMAEHRYVLCEMTFTWHLYGGQDFSTTSTTTAANKEQKNSNYTGMSDAYRHGVAYVNNSNEIKFKKKPKDKLTWKSLGGKHRNHEVLVEVQLTKIRFSHEVYPLKSIYASRQVLAINDIEIRDRLQSSDINKFLYRANVKNLSNRTGYYMLTLKAVHVRQSEKSLSQECSLRISVSPMRLHIDQDTLEFLLDYFLNLDKACNVKEFYLNEEITTENSEMPVMLINDGDEASSDKDRLSEKDNGNNLLANSSGNSPIYFREIVFSPEVSICFDYHGRRVTLSKGPIAGLLMGLGQLQYSKIILKQISYRRGLLGFEKLFKFMFKEWLKDIKRNQLPKILSGVGPTHAFLQLFQGIYDLIWLPIQHYQKDGRIVRGMQLGAQSFSSRTVFAAIELIQRVIQLLQFTAETTYDIVSPGPSIIQLTANRKTDKKRSKQPKDIQEGVSNAYYIVKEGLNDSASNFIRMTRVEHDQKGVTGALGAVIRQVPQLVVCPAVLATQATTNILGGVKSSLVPNTKIEAKKKWKDNN